MAKRKRTPEQVEQALKNARKALRAQEREIRLEIMFTSQALKAREVRAESILDELMGVPKVQVKLTHTHICRDCNESRTCDCDHGQDTLDTRHGCPENVKRRKAILIRLNRGERSPYLTRDEERKPNSAASKLARVNSELSALKAALQQSQSQGG